MNTRNTGMACPIDGTTLVMSDRQNIEIDYCPTCRGVWLDRGELDKIIERSAAEPPAQGRSDAGYGAQQFDRRDYKHHRRKSFLHELFD